MRTRPLVTVITLAIAAVVIAAAAAFSLFVHTSLWEKSVTDVLEVTAQGGNAFDTFFEKELDTLDLFADELASCASDDRTAIEGVINLFDGNDDTAAYLCINMGANTGYRTGPFRGGTVEAEQTQALSALPERGVLEPFIDEVTGVNMIGVYERFAFADGTEGFARKARPLQEVADRFSLSFYDDSGFSYVVDTDGDIVVRSTHRNSNRTMTSIYDLVEHEGNDEVAVASFREALETGKSGVARLSYRSEEYVFCYTPLASTDGWSIVSIIPNSVVMKQAGTILQVTFVLCALIVIGMLCILAAYWASTRKSHRQIRRMAFYDRLTGLYSTDKFYLEADSLLQRTQASDSSAAPSGDPPDVAVAYFNIVDFKLVNDIDGYERGDEVLCKLASIVRDACRDDGIACRQAADHFVMMFPCHSADEATARCEAVVKTARDIEAAGRKLAVRAGVCLASDAPDADTANGLVDRARIAKTAGGGEDRTVRLFNASMRENMLRRAEIERCMESALSEGEFFPLIQPKFSLDGMRVLGGEALVRWNRPNEGVVSPSEFVPIFEQNGFLVKVDEYMFESVCRLLRERIDAGRAVVPLSVNVSRLHLYSSSFVSRYVGIKKRFDIPDGLCELELTEGMVLEDLDNAIEVIRQLREAGFRCSIDDFGSGQSSLNALKDMPADILKLDRAFLFEGGRSEREDVIVRSVIDMARKLNMQTVMEGVETVEQLEFLQTTECDMVQGFVFSRPIPIEEFSRLLDEQAK